MRALSIKQPWASLIVHHGKDIENRTWPTKIRGRIAIHASKRLEFVEQEAGNCLALEITGKIPLRHDFDADGFVVVRRRFHRGDIDVAKTEASEGRRHYIAPLAEELRLYRRRVQGGEGDRLFEGYDDRDFQQHVLRPAAERAKAYTPGFGMHALRRLYITWRQQVGGTPFEAMKAAGHTRPDMTLLYSLTDEQREREQVEAMFGRVNRRLM